MPQILFETVDYSAGWPGATPVLAAGKRGILRYLARDWRGLKPAEKEDAILNGLEIGLVYESTELRPMSGFAGGAYDAAFAQSIVSDLGLPKNVVIYFACDWDFAPEDQAAINDYLRGAASVIGLDRVGIYGGYYVIQRALQAGVAKWFWQTVAWSGGLVLPEAHILQYGFNAWIGGVNCDLNHVYKENFGQVSKAGTHENPDPPIPPVVPTPHPEPSPPIYTKPELPARYDQVTARKYPSRWRVGANTWFPEKARVSALDVTGRYSKPGPSPAAGPKIKDGEIIGVDWVFRDVTNGRKWYVNADGFYRASSFSPDLPLPQPRKRNP
jgi:hypothetical protein